MALATTINLAVTALLTGANDLATEVKATIKGTFSDTLASGTAADQADVVFSDERTLAASADETLDLAGALENALGGAAVFAELVAILIIAAAANTNDVVVGDATAPIIGGPFGAAGDHLIAIPPGGVFFWMTPKNPAVAITGTTADGLKIANGSSGSSVTYKILLIGRSA
jgi:hypothetical protein